MTSTYTIHHVALSVTDRARSIAFYNKLGFSEVHFWEAVDKSLSITHLKLGDSDLILELFCFASPQPAPESIHATATDLPVVGTKHFGLKVESIEAARDDLATKGIVQSDIRITQGRTGPRYFFVEDPDGILVEIAEDKRDFLTTKNQPSMKLYRFSPIQNKAELLEAIKYVHRACNKLCKQSFGEYLPNAGNLGIFCHYDDEYDRLIALCKEMTEASDNVNQKYFRLHEPITIPAQDGIPEATYTHLYIRKPDPYRHHVGDVDFYLEPNEYKELKQAMQNGKVIKGARIFPRQDLDMIELYDPDVDACAYISTEKMAATAHVKQSEETNL
jgi:glyoxylase I family protein